ncbi:hypothetical protein [Variovorax sp. JS1663]|uniref:hypothetical protein n=1 Tax=Variovorax sp. JS1663 TaxID=1851577 RepID=UPI000B3424B3|nr:hypothetical protein [Variovorax sp. JS1663]OUM01768.1 hypothetical protein A8M77_14495 [Variovorax sp. JS1663]
MKIIERYASAVRSSNLKSEARTNFSDSDVLGAMGLADRDLRRGHDSEGNRVWRAPLAVALQRLFLGDNSASVQVVEILSDLAWRQARRMRVKLNRREAENMAKACLAWHRDGRCKPCGGHGYELIPGTKTLGSRECSPCAGSGRIPFEPQFPKDHRELAAWMISEMERNQSEAGPQAMDKLRERMG